MTDINILKYLLLTNEKMNRRMSAILFTLETAFHWECRGALRGKLLTVYTVSYMPPLSQSDCRKFICSIINVGITILICLLTEAHPLVYSIKPPLVTTCSKKHILFPEHVVVIRQSSGRGIS